MLTNEQISQRLCLLENPERIRLAGNWQILSIVRGDLNEQAIVRPALVQLSGGVQKARPIPERRREMESISHPQAQGFERYGVLRSR